MQEIKLASTLPRRNETGTKKVPGNNILVLVKEQEPIQNQFMNVQHFNPKYVTYISTHSIPLADNNYSYEVSFFRPYFHAVLYSKLPGSAKNR
jgi:hypothetical protein